MQKLELRLNDENEIGFKLRIEGSDREAGSSKPKIRFTITEESTNRGWIFGAENKDDNILVNVPDMKGVVKEGNKYTGKLEVILGSRYFTPTEVEVDFIEPLKVEAAIVANKTTKTEKAPTLQEETAAETTKPIGEKMSVESEIASVVIKEKPQKETPKPPVKKQSSKLVYNNLSDEKKKIANQIFLEECKKLDIKDPQKYIKDKHCTSYTKKKLTALMAGAVKKALQS